MVVFSGWDTAFGFTNDVWELGLQGAPIWRPIPTAGNAPIRRANATAVYDPVGQRMLVFGGYDGTSPYRNDILALSLHGPIATWSALVVAGSPPGPRGNHVAIYDPQRDDMVIFGGGGTPLGDLWTLEPEVASDVASTAASKSAPLAQLLHPAQPNPFNPATRLVFDLPVAAPVRMRIFDAAGHRVRDLLDAVFEPGTHQVLWDGRDDRGTRASSGAYTCQLQAGALRSTQRLVLIK
jgi:hypothetical protein